MFFKTDYLLTFGIIVGAGSKVQEPEGQTFQRGEKRRESYNCCYCLADKELCGEREKKTILERFAMVILCYKVIPHLSPLKKFDNSGLYYSPDFKNKFFSFYCFFNIMPY